MNTNAPRFGLAYFWIVFVAAGLTAFVDALLIVPLVEVDPSLTIVNERTASLEAFRAIAPTSVAVVSIVALAVTFAAVLRARFRASGTDAKLEARVLRAPRITGMLVAGGWVVSFLVGLGIDVVTLSFPVVGENVVYYLTSAVAILSTGLFGYLVTYTFVTEANRRLIIPFIFPQGLVSQNEMVRPLGLPGRMMSLWFAVGLFPLIVLGLGTYTRTYVPANEIIAYIFMGVFTPISALLAYRTGQSLHKPLTRIVDATRQISTGDFDVRLRSEENDELGYLTDSTIEMARSLEEKQRISETFGRVVDPRVRDHLLAGNIELGGSRHETAVLFCDIRGFTTYSEHRSEDAVVTMLNEHFLEMDRAVTENGGMINKFLGDGFMAVFGLPIEMDDPCGAAFASALAIVAANARLNHVRGSRDEPAMKLGVGLHFGPVIAGNVGSPTRMEYTVIGDAVNLASRIEGMSKHLDSQIIATDSFASRVDEAVRADGGLKTLGRAEVRGREEKVIIWGAG